MKVYAECQRKEHSLNTGRKLETRKSNIMDNMHRTSKHILANIGIAGIQSETFVDITS